MVMDDKRFYYSRIIAVSYTHLDVYKRQASYRTEDDNESARHDLGGDRKADYSANA